MSPNSHLVRICKPGQGHKTCRYVLADASSITCGKLSCHKDTLDQRVNNGDFVATGDNCLGVVPDIDISELLIDIAPE